MNILKVLGNEDRQAILALLAEHNTNLTVGEIGDFSKIEQPTLSQQLTVLRGSNLVETVKDGKFVLYTLSKAGQKAVLILDQAKQLEEVVAA